MRKKDGSWKEIRKEEANIVFPIHFKNFFYWKNNETRENIRK